MDGRGKTILILGNGFDLAHGLPTGYASFIEFCSRIICIYSYEGSAREYYDEYLQDWDIHRTVKELVEDVFVHTKKMTISVDYNRFKKVVDFANPTIVELYNCIVDNIWIMYFQEILFRNIARGENWIDFEAEISTIIRFLDQYTQNLRQFCAGIYEAIKEEQLTEVTLFFAICRERIKKIDSLEIKQLRERLFNDLENLTRALEIYLSYFVEKIEVHRKISCVANLNPDYVINFNYTHTYERLYKKCEVFHIHGECDYQRVAKKNNMVLGIDEYLAGDERDLHTNYAIFKKFIQRMRKRTGTEHYKYIREIEDAFFHGESVHADYSVKTDVDTIYADGISHVYVFGHSLDYTDKDVLKLFLEPEATDVKIFCKDRGTEGELIASMIKIIREEQLIFKANQRPTMIEFITIK